MYSNTNKKLTTVNLKVPDQMVHANTWWRIASGVQHSCSGSGAFLGL